MHNKIYDNLARRVIELRSYDVTIHYLNDSTNVVVDYLSRSENTKVRFEEMSKEAESIVEFPYCLLFSKTDS